MNRLLSAAMLSCLLLTPAYPQTGSNNKLSGASLAVPVTLKVTPIGQTVAQTVQGTLGIKKFVIDGTGTNAKLVAVGTLTFPFGNAVKVASVAVPVTKGGTTLSTAATVGGVTKLADAQSAQAMAECPILNLTLGPIFIDLLGLVIETNEIQIDITAVSGPGNLLGNLLCAIAGLLDGGGLIANLLQQIADLLNQILGALG